MEYRLPLLDDFGEYSIKIKRMNEEEIDYKKNYLFLINMGIIIYKKGYDKNMIDALFSIYTIVSLEQAIQYLSMENGEWQHNYIQENNMCRICREDSDHIDYKSKYGNPIKEKIMKEKEELNEKISLLSRNSLILKKNSSCNNFSENDSLRTQQNIFEVNPDTEEEEEIKMKSESYFTCNICFFDYSMNDLFELECKHNFCLNCWKSYVENLISEGKIKFSCMQKDCKLLIPEEKLLEITEEEFIIKLNKNKINKLVTTNKNMKFCPIVNCDGYAERIDKNEKNVTCTKNHQFCFDCLQKCHEKKTCSEVLDDEFLKWKEGKVVKRCPNCRFWTEKNEGCNHMTCQNCSYQWCWICLDKYSDGHYGRLGPCEGLQFVNNPVIRSLCNRKIRLVLLYLKNILFYFIITLGFICFGSGILSIIILSKSVYYGNSLTIILRYITTFTFAIIFQPFLLSLTICLVAILIVILILFLPLVLLIYFKSNFLL